jgi:hypothetical protein
LLAARQQPSSRISAHRPKFFHLRLVWVGGTIRVEGRDESEQKANIALLGEGIKVIGDVVGIDLLFIIIVPA